MPRGPSCGTSAENRALIVCRCNPTQWHRAQIKGCRAANTHTHNQTVGHYRDHAGPVAPPPPTSAYVTVESKDSLYVAILYTSFRTCIKIQGELHTCATSVCCSNGCYAVGYQLDLVKGCSTFYFHILTVTVLVRNTHKKHFSNQVMSYGHRY